MSAVTMQPITFQEQVYTVMEDLVNAMGKCWEPGQQFLFSGKLREHITETDPVLAGTCAGAEKEYGEKPIEAGLIFLKWLCTYPGIRGLYWQGENYGDIGNIAEILSEGEDETLGSLLLYMIRSRILGVFVSSAGGDQKLIDNVKYLEKAVSRPDSSLPAKNALPMLEVFFSGRETFTFDGESFRTPAELAARLQIYADRSKAALSRKIRCLFQDDWNFDPHFEAWILMCGGQHEMELWRGRFQQGQNFKGA